MAAPVFVSYGHADQSPVDWLVRLKLYLAQARRSGNMDAWDDGRIEAGADWRKAIATALTDARVAILLVGPAFLASRFIQDHELPPLLEGARSRGVRVFPLVTGWCGYDASDLGAFQAFNDPRHPLESLPLPDQNKILNDLSIAVSSVVERVQAPATTEPTARASVAADAIDRLWRDMQVTGVAFQSQNARCRGLVDAVSKRLGITEHLEFEKFLFRYHGRMTPDELFDFQQIRAVTDGPLAEGNRRMLDILLDHPAVAVEIPSLTALRQHLVFWMNKYERVFRNTPAMAVCYVGVEDGVPWPQEAERAVRAWLDGHARRH